jgi:hypothetical protein
MGLSTCHIRTDGTGARLRQTGRTWPFAQLELDNVFLHTQRSGE